MRFTSAFTPTLLSAWTVLATSPFAGYRVTGLTFTYVVAEVHIPQIWFGCSSEPDTNQFSSAAVAIGDPLACHGGPQRHSIEAGVSFHCRASDRAFGYNAYWQLYPYSAQTVPRASFEIVAGNVIQIKLWVQDPNELWVSFAQVTPGGVPGVPYSLHVGSSTQIAYCATTAAWYFRASMEYGQLMEIPDFDFLGFREVDAYDVDHHGLDEAQRLDMEDAFGYLWAWPVRIENSDRQFFIYSLRY